MPIFAKIKLGILIGKLILLIAGGFIGYKIIKDVKAKSQKEKNEIYFGDGVRKPSLTDVGTPCHASVAESSIFENRMPCKASLPVFREDMPAVNSEKESQELETPEKKRNRRSSLRTGFILSEIFKPRV